MIIDMGYDNVFERNLIMQVMFPSTYNGANERNNEEMYAGLEVYHDPKVTMIDNVIAGRQ